MNQLSGKVMLDNVMEVTTPENIAFQYRLVGPFSRLLAYVYDVLISLLFYVILCFVIYMAGLFIFLPMIIWLGFQSFVPFLSGVFWGLAQIGYFFIHWFYGVYFEARNNGQTPGKRMFGMRVISTDGHSIDAVQATLRNFFRLLDTMPMVTPSLYIAVANPIEWMMLPTFAFGLIVMTISPRFQRIGDLIAGTVVVDETKLRKPNLAVVQEDQVQRLAEKIPGDFVVSSTLGKVIAEYVDQRRYLAHQRASEIAGHLAIPLIDQLGLPPKTDYDLLICAIYYRTYFAREEENPDSKNDHETGAIWMPQGKSIRVPSTDASIRTGIQDPKLSDSNFQMAPAKGVESP
ncbi:MAG: RDD family protein [Planctomycetota bacterium]